MSKKSFALNKNDAVVQQFSAGVRAWEHPHRQPDSAADVGTSGPARKANTIRARGAVRVRERVISGETNRSQCVPPLSDDLVVVQFRDGLAHWERPFEGWNEND
jgi:hypothetical protein